MTSTALQQLSAFLDDKQQLTVLTGAGISAGSGIPTYRDRNGVWLRSDPVQHQQFITQPHSRQRYWLRSYSGWPAVARAEPSATHRALVKMESAGLIRLLVTQNVDRLHQRAGSRRVIDLHGRLDRVVCLDCRGFEDRADVQARLKRANPFMSQSGEVAPDGDAEADEQRIDDVVLPSCQNCDGLLKPDVVFFGDNVDRDIVQHIYDEIEKSDGLLIIGSSLKVFSGYRFCRYAADHGLPLASINPGVTRADHLIGTRVSADADDILPRLYS